MPEKIENDVLCAEALGEEHRRKFVEERLAEKNDFFSQSRD